MSSSADLERRDGDEFMKSPDDSSDSPKPESLPKETVPEPILNADPVSAPGVATITNFYRVSATRYEIWLLYFSLAIISCAYSLAQNTVFNFLAFATSDLKQHSSLSTVDTVINIIAAVAKPFIAKLADLASRPTAYTVSLVFYIVGFVMMACTQNIGTVCGAEILYTIGSTGIEIVTDIIIADISPLKWRGFVGSLPSAPFIVNAFISGYIVDGLGSHGWRWGYGMFAIIQPVAMAPALLILFRTEYKARKNSALNYTSSSSSKRGQGAQSQMKVETSKREEKVSTTIVSSEKQSWWQILVYYFGIIDALGLVLLGTAWTLIFLPFTLKDQAKHGYSNSSLIAMWVAGPIVLVAFTFWEVKITRYPLMPLRILNRTLVLCFGIDMVYYLAGYLRDTYFSSWTWVVRNWSAKNWTMFNNSQTVAFFVFGLICGLIQRRTKEYKWLLMAGLSINAIGMGLTLYSRRTHATDVALVWTQMLTSIGGGILVVCTRVAAQASVAHVDLAQSIALLALWTNLAGAVGTAIAGAVWTDLMPKNLNKQLSGKLSAQEIFDIFGSITIARDEPPEIRSGVIQAYNDTVHRLYVPALVLSFLPLIFAFFVKNYRLDDRHNAVEDTTVFKEGKSTSHVNPSHYSHPHQIEQRRDHDAGQDDQEKKNDGQV